MDEASRKKLQKNLESSLPEDVETIGLKNYKMTVDFLGQVLSN